MSQIIKIKVGVQSISYNLLESMKDYSYCYNLKIVNKNFSIVSELSEEIINNG